MFGKFVLRTLVGMLIALPLYLASGYGRHNSFAGGDALTTLALIIICTGGLALLVIVPACYLIGLVCTIWFIPFGRGT